MAYSGKLRRRGGGPPIGGREAKHPKKEQILRVSNPLGKPFGSSLSTVFSPTSPSTPSNVPPPSVDYVAEIHIFQRNILLLLIAPPIIKFFLCVCVVCVALPISLPSPSPRAGVNACLINVFFLSQ